MQVKEQIRLRMTELQVSVKQLSVALGVSDQTVRHWLSGRSFPGKSKAPALERALSFKLDYSQGATQHLAAYSQGTAQHLPADARADVEGLLAITRLPPNIRKLIFELAAAIGTQGQGPK
jgi:transcriptional regulator with XRE-family HTH domain